MLTKRFFYHLPNELIAKYPVKNRGESRLLHLNKETGAVTHNNFIDLVQYLDNKDLLILNNTTVMPARLHGYKDTGGKVEILIERLLEDQCALVHIGASKAPKIESYIYLTYLKNPIKILVKAKNEKTGLYLIQFLLSDLNLDLLDLIEQIGEVPIPNYLGRKSDITDNIRYQTVYARKDKLGSVAAHTAGLHFENSLFFTLKSKGISLGELTLHIGAGTFRPVKVENIYDHTMHSEYIEVPQELCEQIIAAKNKGGRVICVGTTTMRAIESAFNHHGDIKPYVGETNLFITPGFKFNVADGLLTNFHLPESTLLILVCAFAGTDNVLQAYQEAVANDYRFFSYGDAMLILS